MMNTDHAASPETASPTYNDDPDIRMLRRASPLADFPIASDPIGDVLRVAVVDCETTGLDVARDEIIDIAVVVILVDAIGRIVGIESKGEALRDPGMPIPPAITKLTGLTDHHVRDQYVDLDRLEHVIGSADLRIAHNASFDARFIEALLPGLAKKSWACSANDFDWLDQGFDGRKLGHLLMQISRFNIGHRAMVDVVSLIHLLAHRTDNGRTVIGQIIEKARQLSYRIEATRAPFDTRSCINSARRAFCGRRTMLPLSLSPRSRIYFAKRCPSWLAMNLAGTSLTKSRSSPADR